MTADVYADDDALRSDVRVRRLEGAATFNIVADADSDVLARVSAVLNLLNVAPLVFHMETQAEGFATVSARVDCAAAQAELVARKLLQLTSVRNVVVDYAKGSPR